MKILLTILLVALGVAAQAQTFNIQKFHVKKVFISDSATQIRIACIRVVVSPNTAEQRPVFYLELLNKDGQMIEDRNIEYKDMVNACIKNGIPEEEQSQEIANAYAVVFVGTKAQKVYVLNRMLQQGYGITVLNN